MLCIKLICQQRNTLLLELIFGEVNGNLEGLTGIAQIGLIGNFML